jgi:PAS domain S-box-containing protein
MSENKIASVNVFPRDYPISRDLFELLPVGVVVHDFDGRITSANPAAQRILGLSFDQMRGVTSIDPLWKATYVDGSNFPGKEHPAMVALKTKVPVLDVVMGVFNPTEHSQTWINIRATPILNDQTSEVQCVYAFFEDISDRVTKLKLAEEGIGLYREIFDSAKEAIFVSDLQGNLLDVNEEACRLTKYSREQMLRLRNVDIVAQTEVPRIASELATADSGIAVENRWQLLCSDGSTVPLDLVVQRLVGDKYLAIGRDVTDRERSMNELAAARDFALAANLAKTRFLAAASHDLRQPIQAIGMFHHALQRTDLNPEQQHLHELLGMSVRNLGDLLNSLLDISRLDAGAVVPRFDAFGVKAVFQGLDTEFWPLADSKSLRLRFCYPARDLVVRSDPKLISTLLGNLISNAIKYTERGSVLVSARKRGGHAVIQVWDTGIGISAEHEKDIFEEYLQLGNPERDRTKGLGLGLAIVKRLARLLNTDVTVRSQLGRGSVFEFSLPITQALCQQSKTDPKRPNAMMRNLGIRRVVIVEDDVMVSTGLELLFESMGMKVETFSSATDALESASTMGEEADFYLTDLRLPDLSGLEFLQILQQRQARAIKAAILTGDTSPDRIEIIKSSAWPVLFKPIEPEQLLRVMEEQDVCR